MATLFSYDVCLYSVQIPIAVFTLLFLWLLLRSYLPKQKVSDFHKKYVLITGCDSGFGKKTAILLNHLGFHVIATCLTDQGKQNIQEACSDCAISIVMDVTDSKRIQNVYSEVKQMIPPEAGLWAVINNAGYMTLGPLEWFKLDEYKRMADVNLWGLIDVTKTFLPLVKKAKGRVINISSIAGLVCPIGFAPYSITKYGIEAFSDALRREMISWDVNVCIIEPQGFKTALLDQITDEKLKALWDGISDEMRQEYGEENFEKFKTALIDRTIKGVSENIDLVVNDVIDAVTSRNPQPRYLIGGYAKVVGFFALLPTTLQDYIFKPL